MPTAIVQEPLAWLLSAVGLLVPAFRTSTVHARREGEIRRVVTVNRSIQHVFSCFARYTSWPRFMRRLYRVEDLGFGLSHWKAAGPAGLPIDWYARVTRYIPNDLIAWQSESTSTLPIAGSIRFEPAGPDRTRVLIRLSYQLPGGRLGQFVAWLFGIDVESALDEELGRIKEWIEEEQPAADVDTSLPALAGTSWFDTR